RLGPRNHRELPRVRAKPVACPAWSYAGRLRRLLSEGQVPTPAAHGLSQWLAHGAHALAHCADVPGRLILVTDRDRSDRGELRRGRGCRAGRLDPVARHAP